MNQPDAPVDSPPSNCQPIPAQGQFVRRQGNPRLVAGTQGGDGMLDIRIADPDVRFDATAQRFELYFTAERNTVFTPDPAPSVIRRATSVDRMTWTVDAAPVLAPGTGFDSASVEGPTVVFDPDAPADRRYLMLYAGSTGAFPHAGFSRRANQIGAAISADGIAFTRVGTDGLVLTVAQAYPGAADGIVEDPELVLVDGIYHVWFSSLACEDAACATLSDVGVAHATSADGITWTVDQAPVRSLLRASADDLTGGRAPSVIYDAVHCRFELWQSNDLAADVASQPANLDNTAGVWKAESTDGASWSVLYTGARDVAWNAGTPAAGEHLGMQAGFDVAESAGGRLMIYPAIDDQNVPAGFTVPDRGTGTPRPGVTVLGIATRDLP
jgi:predicted GH43/DUF377 family glycosyl hydrolase